MIQPNEFERLEAALIGAGRKIEYPATPPISARVFAELTSGAVSNRHIVARPVRFAFAVAVALLLAFGLLLAFPAGRDAVAQILGLPGLRVFYATPTPPPTSTPTAAPTATGTVTTRTATPRPSATPTVKPFTLCCETTLADAQNRARFHLLVPPDETPSAVYYQNVYNNGEQVVMVFGDPAHPRYTLYQAQSWIYGKLLGANDQDSASPQTVIGEAQVRGERALWFSGAPHIVMKLDANGEPLYETARTVDANTLAWGTGDQNYDGIVYRLETMLPLTDAVAFANALR